MPRVSVVVPFRNVRPYFAQCLDSILGQTMRDIEIICVDDGSRDGSLDIARERAATDPRLRIIRLPEPLGPGDARNHGMREADGKYTAFVDSDDWIVPETLERQAAAIEAAGTDTLMSSHLHYYEESGTLEKRYSGPPTGPLEIHFGERFRSTFVVWSKLYRTSFLRDNGVEFPPRIWYEDTEFYFKVFCLSPRTHVLDEPFYIYRQRANSIMGNTMAGAGRCLDMRVVGVNCLRFIEERGLFDSKKGEYLDFLAKAFMSFVRSRHYRREFLTGVKPMLPEIGFPGRYAGLENCYGHRVLRAIRDCRPDTNPGWYILLKILNKMNPLPESRRKWRTWIRINCEKRR